MLKRLFDILCSAAGLLLLSPFLLFISMFILLDSRGGIFYRQLRVGKNGKDFYMYKFRTMYTGSDKSGLITIGNRDNRITRAGYYLRKYKLDELLQLLNVLEGTMSLAGPRPEVRKYVDMYTEEQQKVLSVKPGITDYASIVYSGESELLAQAGDPEKYYVEKIMPAKLKLNLLYIEERNLMTDFRIVLKTLLKIAKQSA